MIKYYLTKIEVAKASCVPSLRDEAMPFFQYLPIFCNYIVKTYYVTIGVRHKYCVCLCIMCTIT